jgi:hypothetical protein
MKIKKQLIVESTLAKEIEALEEAASEETSIDSVDTVDSVSNDDMIVDDVLSASTTEIADAVQTAAETASEGEETYSDTKAEKVAAELKTFAKGLDNAKWAPLDVPSALTDALDACLAESMIAQKSGRKDGTDILINGLPGSGKTGITKQWADDRGVNLFYLNAKNDDLGAILNGFPVDTVDADEEGNPVHKVQRSYSNALDPLKEPRSVLFLDEFNRAAPKLRATLLTLINEHTIEGPGKKGIYRFDNLLFTIACVNPSVPTDPGAMNLNDAEKSRFATKMKWDSKADDAIRYLTFYINKTINGLDKSDEDYAYLYVKHKKVYNLAMALLNDARFEFDTRDDLLDLFNEDKTMLNQRSITDGLLLAGNDKAKFLNWVDNNSDFLQRDIDMIHDILDSWVEPDVSLPGTSGTNTESEVEAPTNTTAQSATASDSDEGDFESIFGSDGEETDSDLFGSSASAAGAAAKVSAADALNRIKGFDFSL